MDQQREEFFRHLAESITKGTFVKLSLGNYKGTEEALKQLFIKPVFIKNTFMLAFNYRYKTRDIFKNYFVKEGTSRLQNYVAEGFCIATLFTDVQEFILEKTVKGSYRLRTNQAAKPQEVSLSHNKEKKRLIAVQNNVYLQELGLTDDKGMVFKNAQDKYKQINKYIEILSSLINELPDGTIKNVVDMGSGKGYLTFALYDYLSKYHHKANVVGVEFRNDMVALCNDIAEKASFDKLSFVEGTIEDYSAADINLLIALHACDTATDDAIFKGIKANAELIVVAPCCHKQIRREIEKHNVKNDVSFLTKYGIFLERQAEMVTDGIRALILEYYGYKTKVFEFISDVHTPKNVLVVGIKSKDKGVKNKEEILQKIKETKTYFGISYHHLERLLDFQSEPIAPTLG